MPYSSAIVRSPILELMGGERPFTSATNAATQYYAGKTSAVTYASAATLLQVEGLQPGREQVRNIGHVRDSLMLIPLWKNSSTIARTLATLTATWRYTCRTLSTSLAQS
ncbi:hypothetical protein EMGBD1_04270 [Anaerolineaceae bacterium]|nr:hypothetical protein EMGBD1_04270 [Anaerolineaceae bacterium]